MPPERLDRLNAEHDNMRVALAWLEANGDAEGLVRLAGALGWFWLYRSHRTEGRRWLERAVVAARDADLRTVEVARTLDGATVMAFMQGDYARARDLGAAYLTLARELGNASATATALNLLGAVARAQGEHDLAARHLEEALTLFRQGGNPGWVALALDNLGVVAYWQGDLERARTRLGEALALYRQFGDAYGTAVALSDLALVHGDLGDRSQAAALLVESLERWREVGTKEGLVDWLARVATLATANRQAGTAARLLGAVEATREAIGYTFEQPERARQRRAVDVVLAALGDAGFAAAWAAGRELALIEAIAEASTFLAGPTAATAAVGLAGHDEGGGGAGLTPREIEVRRLLVEGRSDPQIGEELSISHRTVMRHVEHILTKLEVESRTAAATQAVRRGLV